MYLVALLVYIFFWLVGVGGGVSFVGLGLLGLGFGFLCFWVFGGFFKERKEKKFKKKKI